MVKKKKKFCAGIEEQQDNCLVEVVEEGMKGCWDNKMRRRVM